jgi:hypothetical protein
VAWAGACWKTKGPGPRASSYTTKLSIPSRFTQQIQPTQGRHCPQSRSLPPSCDASSRYWTMTTTRLPIASTCGLVSTEFPQARVHPERSTSSFEISSWIHRPLVPFHLVQRLRCRCFREARCFLFPRVRYLVFFNPREAVQFFLLGRSCFVNDSYCIVVNFVLGMESLYLCGRADSFPKCFAFKVRGALGFWSGHCLGFGSIDFFTWEGHCEHES